MVFLAFLFHFLTLLLSLIYTLLYSNHYNLIGRTLEFIKFLQFLLLSFLLLYLLILLKVNFIYLTYILLARLSQFCHPRPHSLQSLLFFDSLFPTLWVFRFSHWWLLWFLFPRLSTLWFSYSLRPLAFQYNPLWFFFLHPFSLSQKELFSLIKLIYNKFKNFK